MERENAGGVASIARMPPYAILAAASDGSDAEFKYENEKLEFQVLQAMLVVILENCAGRCFHIRWPQSLFRNNPFKGARSYFESNQAQSLLPRSGFVQPFHRKDSPRQAGLILSRQTLAPFKASHMTRFLLLVLLAVSSTASAIVIRHDVNDSKYRIPASEFAALVEIPGEGHGVLIAPQWVITAAHTLPRHSEIKQVVINGIARDVERVVIHSGYKTPAQELINQAMASGEAILIVVALASSDDIALVKLKQTVTDVAPVAIYKDSDEPGQIIKIVGKGATGTGASGHGTKGPNRTELRRAFNKITSAHERWFCYVFDEPASALPLEGITGNGDSGGPVLIEAKDKWLLAGVAAWKVVQGNIMTARPGVYGQTNCNVRLSHYNKWVESVIAAHP